VGGHWCIVSVLPLEFSSVVILVPAGRDLCSLEQFTSTTAQVYSEVCTRRSLPLSSTGDYAFPCWSCFALSIESQHEKGGAYESKVRRI
jgi:hypothetical protein